MAKMKLFVIGSLLVGLALSGCTTTRWMVQDRHAVDTRDSVVIQREPLLRQAATVTPEQPVLDLAVYERQVSRVSERLRMERYIQRYRPKWGFMTLSMMASGLSLYAAHTDRLVKNQSKSQSIALSAAGGVMAASAFLNMKPVGDPQPTGETRLQRKTGELLRTDTVQVSSTDDIRATADIYYGDSLLTDDMKPTRNGGDIQFNLASLLNPDILKGLNTDSLHVQVNFRDVDYHYSVAVSQVLNPYAEVESDVSELRSAPRFDEEVVMMDLARGSRLRIQQKVDDQWYKVLYGLSPAYINIDHASVVWRRSDSESASNIVEVPNVPYGQIDVESNVPVLASKTKNAAGLLIANENYRDGFSAWSYGLRDQRLLKQYMKTALGFPESQLVEVRDFRDPGKVQFASGRVAGMIKPDSTELLVTIMGRGRVTAENGDLQWYLAPVQNAGEVGSGRWVNLRQLFKRIAGWPTRETVVWIDVQFEVDKVLRNSSGGVEDYQGKLARLLTDRNPESAVIFSAQSNQQPGLYVDANGTDKRHHILPYYLAKGIQERHTSLFEMQRYLERNVTYTSRRLYDRPQEPAFYGNLDLDLRGGH